MLLVLTMEGFLGDPSYGGNKDEVGWALVGLRRRSATQAAPPQPGYDGAKTPRPLHCGGGKGC